MPHGRTLSLALLVLGGLLFAAGVGLAVAVLGCLLLGVGAGVAVLGVLLGLAGLFLPLGIPERPRVYGPIHGVIP